MEPEKIYINPNLENRTWLIGKGDTSFIEYTRTDAFIEKVEKWMRENFVNDQGLYCVITDYNTVNEMIEDFKKCVKEE